MRYYDRVKQLSLRMIVPLCSAVSIALGGCAGGETSFDSPESAARLRAIHQAAADDDRNSIPKLIEMLESDDPAVRVLSIRTLESMTGQTLGYDATAPSFERTPAVDRWQQWYAASAGGAHKQRPDGTSRVPGPTGGAGTASDPSRPENRNTGMSDLSAHNPGLCRVFPGGGAGAME